MEVWGYQNVDKIIRDRILQGVKRHKFQKDGRKLNDPTDLGR